MLSVLVALWLLFGFNQGSEHRLVAHNTELSDQKKCSVSADIGDDPSKPRVVQTSWSQIKLMFHG
jgi:hypothetical protein